MTIVLSVTQNDIAPLQFKRDFLLEALTVLKNRGYDSAGVATMPEDGGSMVSFGCQNRLLPDELFSLCIFCSRSRNMPVMGTRPIASIWSELIHTILPVILWV